MTEEDKMTDYCWSPLYKKGGKMTDELLTLEEILQIYKEKNWMVFEPDLHRAETIAKAQLDHTLQRFKNALEQSRKGEDIDLSEEEFELFSAIQNDGIAKSHRRIR